ncbi:BCNT-domain-containing protein [Tuber magnatum]|uniref:SWR1-complex protein 5 n=1 Tax=Tuber magnatum TaxID=42249 RepID=A0A317T0E0_9PEZI|nr:BCNT-domain-containing protein [Tuber magnatum]
MTPPHNSQTKTSASEEPNPTTLLLATAAEEDYNSAEDEDFDPAAVPERTAEESASSDSEPEHLTTKPKQKRKRRRGSFSSEGSYGDISGGEGGLIKTRAQRLKESTEKEKDGGVLGGDTGATTTDVDELWRQMNSKPNAKRRSPLPETKKREVPDEEKNDKGDEGSECTTTLGEETITISRTYTFAGNVVSEAKTVPKSSHEAQTYLSTLPSASSIPTPFAPSAPANGFPPRRPPPKKRASAFDSAAAARKPATPTPTQKLNTLEKSRLDWAGFVDKEGIGDELKKHTSGDKSYLDRQAFLGRVDEKRERAWKEGKGK